MIAGSKLNDVAFTFGKLGKMPLGNCRFAPRASGLPNMDRQNEPPSRRQCDVDEAVPDLIIWRLLNISRHCASHNSNPFSPKTTERFGNKGKKLSAGNGLIFVSVPFLPTAFLARRTVVA
jgi:hypothetical protein